MSSRIYSERVTGSFPISIASSLAIEGVLGKHPDRPTNRNELINVDVILVNVKTIFRNFHNAINKDDLQKCHPDEWSMELLREMEVFQEIITDVTSGKTIVQYYLPDYKDLKTKFPNAILRDDVTELQIQYTKRLKAVIQNLLLLRAINIRLYPFLITDEDKRNCLMMTHIAPDLFTRSIRNKKLLESHTGAVKGQSQWYTKYYNGQNLIQIPFRLDLVQIFGDNELFRPWGIKAKNEILQLAEKYNWSQVTSTEKIRYSIEQCKDHALRRTVLDMLETS